MQFRLWTVLYVFALVAAAMATFGNVGVIVAAIVLIGWRILLNPKTTRSQRTMEFLAFLGSIVLLIGLVLSALKAPRESSRHAGCWNNLHQVSMALMLYEEQNEQLPQAIARGDSGVPHHSWRTAILPFLEYQSLFEQYRFDEPWNGPNNRPLVNQSIDIFSCPSVSIGRPRTNYYAVVDDKTVWPADRAFALQEITDEPSETIMLIEAAGLNTPWAEPTDLTFDQAVEILVDARERVSTHHFYRRNVGFFQKGYNVAKQGIHVAMADGSVCFLPLPVPRETAIALLTANGGEAIDDALIWRMSDPQLDWAKIYGFAVFVILALLPAYRLIRCGIDHATN